MNRVLSNIVSVWIGSCCVLATLAQESGSKPASPPATTPPPEVATAPPATAGPAPIGNAPSASAPAHPSAPGERNIRFQFDSIPYTDLLERFAQMVNKPLVSDTNLQGTVTFNDPKPYNYQEALDTLNLILSMKDMTLIEEDHYLRLVPLKKLPQLPVRILRGTDNTGDVRPGEVVTVVLEMKNLDAKEVSETVSSMLSNAGSVAPLTRGHGLIVTDRMENIQRIRSLLNLIDTQTVTDRQMKSYTLLHASGAVVADLINRTFGVATAPKRTQYNQEKKQLDTLPADPNDYVTAVYDDASRTLVLYGPRERVDLAEQLISKFEDKEGGTGGDVRIYFPQVNKAEDLAQMIRQAIPGVAGANENATTAATKARLIVDATQNRLIVAAPIAGQLDAIENLINRVDKPVNGAGAGGLRSQTVQITKVFRPRNSDANSLAKILTNALTRRLPSGVTVPSANVTVEPTSQSVVVTGSPGDVQTAVDVVSQLENGSGLALPQQTKLIDVGTVAEAKRLAPLIEQIYRSQFTDTVGGQAAHAKIVADAETGRLIVTASEDHVRRIEEIIQQLKSERARPQERHLQIVTLKHLQVESVLPSLTNLVNERMSDARFEDLPKPLLLPDAANNRLLITATEGQFKEITAVIAALDVGAEKGQRAMRVIPVQSKSASELITLTLQLMNQMGEGQANPQSAPKLIADASGKQIIVLASPEDMARVTNLVQQLDNASTSATARQFQSIELYSRNTAELTPLVQQLYQEQLKGQPEPAGGPATLLAEPKQNKIMVSGSEKEIARVQAIVRQLDPEGKRGAKDETRVIRLKTAVAADLAGLVDKSLTAQGQQVKVLVDTRSNSLVVTGEAGAVEAAAQIIGQLDTQSDVGPRELRLIELKSADANTLAPMVTTLFTDIIKDQRGPDYKPQTKITADSAGSRLIVTGSKDELKTISSLVEQLDVLPETAGMARVFKLTMADANSLVTVVSNAMVRFDARGRPIRLVSVSADDKSNSLIVSGSRADLQDAQAIIERLDGEGIEKGRTLKVLEVATDDPDGLAALATKVFTAQNPGRNVAAVVSITPEPSGKRLIVLAPPSMITQVETVISTLDAKPDQGARELQTVELKTASAQKILPTVRRIYGEQTQGKSVKPATIYPDSTGTRLLVYGTKDQGAAVRQIVETMISSTAQARETRAFDVGSAEDVRRLLPLVQQLYQEQWKEKGDSDPADAQILPDARTGRLMVTGKPDHIKQIEAILNQLNTAKPRADGRDTRIIDLTTANAAELANTVRTLYQEEAKSRLGDQAPDVLILPDTSANRLIVTGDSTEVQAVEEVVQKLDKISAQSGTVRVFKLKYADPSKVLEILTNALTSYDSYGRARRRVGVTVDSKTRSIIVAGDPKELQSLQNAAIIIEQLDNALGQQAERKIKVLTLKQSKVSEMLPKVRQLYNDQLASKPDLAATEVLMLEDPTSNQLILAGSDAQLDLVGTILHQLETAQVEKGKRETKIIEIGQVDEMQRLLPLVRQLYREHWRDKAGDPADAQIVADDRNARFIVTARTNHIAEIESIITQLRAGTMDHAARETRIYDLTTATANELASTVKSLYQEQGKNRPGVRLEDTVILPDASANRLIVTASTNELNLVEEIIKKLDKVSAQSASVRVFKIKSDEPNKVTEILSTALVSYDSYGRPRKRVSVSVDPKSRTIIAAGDPKELQGVSVIVEQLDTSLGSQAERHMRVLPVKSSRAAELLTKLRALYDDQIKAQPDLGTSDVLMLEDETSNQLILAGSEKQLDLMASIASQLEASTIIDDTRETRVYELTSSSAPELATTVKSLYQEAMKGHPTPPARQALVMPDINANRLIVSGTTNDLKLIDDIVQKIDKTEAQTGRTRVFKLKLAEAQQVGTILSTALVQIGPNGRSTPRVSVGTDLQNNLLIVSGAPQDLQSAAVIVEQMDAMLAKEPRQMRVLPLTNGLASEVASKVRQLYLDQLKGKTKTSPPDAIIMGDDVSSRLIIAAGESHLKLIEDIVNQLQEVGAGSSRQIRVLSLQRNSGTSVAAMITQLFSRQVASQDPSQHLSVTASADDRTVALDATPVVLERVEQLVKTLDGEDALGKVEVRTYQLPEGNVIDLAPTLARLFAEKVGQTTPSGLAPRFEADGSANVLIVAATKDQFTQIDKLIEEIKNTARVANEIRTFKLQNGDPGQIADVLQSMLTDGDQPAPGQPRQRRMQWRPGVGLMPVTDAKSVRVAPARSLNAVVVQGPPEKLALAEKLIQSLDKDEVDSRTVIQTVRLKKAHAENLADAVNRTISARGPQTRLQRVTVTAVIGPNSLLLNGPADAVQDVMQVIRDLDQESEDDEIKVHIYKLENGNAREVSAVIQQLLQNVVRSQIRLRSASATSPANAARFVQPSVSVDERSNSLVISGTSAQFKVVEQLLSTLDKVPDRAERDVQFVWLRNAKAFDVASKLEAVFAGRPETDKPVIDADLFNNSITIIGKRADIVQLQDLVARLDESSKDTSMQVRLRPLDRVPVEQMARMLQNIYPQMSAGTIRVTEKIQPPARSEKAGSVIAPLDAKPGSAPPAPQPSSGAAERKPEEDRNAPEVVVAIDRNANALILSGPTHELDQIDHIISELSFSYISSDAEFRVFPLKEADPVVVARTLTDLFKPEQIQVPPQPAGQGNAQRPNEVRVVAQTPKVTAVAEPRTRSVIVRAKPTDFTLMETLIKQLDVAGVSSQLEFRVVVLTNAPPQKIAPLVQQMVTQLNVIRPGEPLSVLPDARTHGLLVVARDAVLRQVESMIHSLDTPAPYSEAEVLVLSLKKANAPQLAGLLQSMLKPGAQGETTADGRELQEQVRRLKIKNDAGQEVSLDLEKPIRIMGDPLAGGQGGGNRLVLSSTPDNLKALAAVVEMMDTVPLAEGVNVKLIHLEFADAATVSQTLNTIFSQGQRLGVGPGGRAEPEGSAGKALVNPLNVAVDTRSNSLILSGQKESLDLAAKVVSDLDRKIERFMTDVRLFRLKHASARRLAPLLQSVFAEGPSVPGTEGLATAVTRLRAVLPDQQAQVTEQPKVRSSALVIQAEDTTNVLIVAARTDSMPLIEAVINQLDIPSASGMDNIRVYALDHADPTVVQKIISDLHSGPRASQIRVEDIPNVTIDERTQSLIVSGNQKAFAFIDGLIAQLDKELPLELRDVRILPLDNADAATVAASLQRLLDARVTQKSALGKQQAEALRVLVIAEQRSNSLLVAGSKDSFELVEALAHELDSAPPALSGRIRLIPLRYADARALSTSLLTLFNQRYQSARSPETQRNRPVIVPDPRSNSLLVAAGVDDNQAIDDLVGHLDQHLDDPSMVLTVLGLRHNNSATVATTLESIFAARLRARTVPGQPASPQDAIKIEPDSLNNSLIVSASRENLELIVGLLQKIDVEPVVAEGVIQTFTLENADAQRVANMLRTLIQQGLYRPGGAEGNGRTPREAMAITVDTPSNTLVVSASPENLMVIKEVIRHLDTKDLAQSGNIHLYLLKHARASSLASVLDQFFRARRASEAGGNAAERSLPVTVVPDDRVNALLVTGGKESFDVIDRMIEQLDGDDVQSRMGFRIFVLKRATAGKLQSTLQRLFTNRPPRVKGEQPEPITIVADSWVNAVLVGASVDDMGMVASLIERLDSEQTDLGATVQVFPLAKADSRRVAQIIQSLYREGGPSGALTVSVSADERMNAIVVSAGETDLKRIGDLVKKLDTDQVGRVSEIRIFPLQHGRADSISGILNTALNTKPVALNDQSPATASLLQFITRSGDGKEFVASALKEGVLITPDPRMNSLVVSAPVDYMNLLEQIINRLDSSAPQKAKIKVFTLINADARLMAQLIMTLFRLQPTGQPLASQRAIQYTLVRDQVPLNGVNEESPKTATETEVASATLGTDEQDALHVTVDERTNSLLVGGTEHYVALVSQIIQELDSSEAQERRSDIYRLRNAQATDIAIAIRTFLDQDRQRITQVLGQEAVGTAQRMLEREVAIVAETNSNTLLLSASPRYFGQLTNMIISLDQPRPQVLIQVLLAEVTLDSTQDLGVEWNISKTVGNSKVNSGTDFGVPSDLKSFGGFSAAVTGSDYSFLIRALQNDGRLEILSRPQILTADNKPANIDVGQRVPLISNTSTTPQGGTVNSIDYENVGVHLQVTPRIGADGAVRMEISTTNSALTSSSVTVPTGSGDASLPIINERKASTYVSVQSGQSILIGGLIENSEDDRTKKVPYLGDIPGLGVLFRSKTKVITRRELLILLTPQVLLLGTEHKIESVDQMTREQLEKSSMKDQIRPDPFRDRLVEPLYPGGFRTNRLQQMAPAPK